MACRADNIAMITACIGDDMDVDEDAFDAALDQLGFGAFSDAALEIIASEYAGAAASAERTTTEAHVAPGDNPERAN